MCETAACRRSRRRTRIRAAALHETHALKPVSTGAVGGVMAYQKKGSRASLLASAGIAAALLLGAALMTGRTRVAGTLLALGARPHQTRSRFGIT